MRAQSPPWTVICSLPCCQQRPLVSPRWPKQHLAAVAAGRALIFESAQQSLKAIQRLPCYQHLTLQPFTAAEVQHFMSVALDRDNIPDQIAAAVHERTGGLPLYVEQVQQPSARHITCLPDGLVKGTLLVKHHRCMSCGSSCQKQLSAQSGSQHAEAGWQHMQGFSMQP